MGLKGRVFCTTISRDYLNRQVFCASSNLVNSRAKYARHIYAILCGPPVAIYASYQIVDSPCAPCQNELMYSLLNDEKRAPLSATPVWNIVLASYRWRNICHDFFRRKAFWNPHRVVRSCRHSSYVFTPVEKAPRGGLLCGEKLETFPVCVVEFLLQ